LKAWCSSGGDLPCSAPAGTAPADSRTSCQTEAVEWHSDTPFNCDIEWLFNNPQSAAALRSGLSSGAVSAFADAHRWTRRRVGTRTTGHAWAIADGRTISRMGQPPVPGLPPMWGQLQQVGQLTGSPLQIEQSLAFGRGLSSSR
jgi:hypothetical protein